jgi:hypothetical protein
MRTVSCPRWIVLALLATSIGFASSCGGGGSPNKPGTDLGPVVDAWDAGPDAGVQDPGPGTDTGTDEGPSRDLSDAFEVPEVPDASDVSDPGTPDVGPQCPGEFGCPCEDNESCYSGFCIPTMEGDVCTRVCAGDDSCPKGWSCVIVSGSGSDVVYACMDRYADLCRPCKEDLECKGVVDSGKNLCVDLGPEGRFCGVECKGAGDCPDGFECAPQVSGRGEVNQCVPSGGGQCPCTDRFKKQGYETVCYVQNDFGKCLGQRTCDAMCDAAVPLKEECNAKDDNCDGAVDEGLSGGDCDLKNEFGTCKGQSLCLGGKPFCQGTYATPETCNGVDDNCDGTKDEGFLDTDKDGEADCVDLDMDGDGVPNVTDNCPLDPNPGQENHDGDKDGDACDPDDDNDGVPDETDNCPLAANPLQEDLDGDKTGNACDCDIDGDGVNNDNEPWCPAADPKDNCPYAPNPDQKDSNGDGVGDACEGDPDSDGVPDTVDNCPLDPNPGQENHDGDKDGDACDPDDDNDGVPDGKDNCPLVANPQQEDFDLDGLGDACDEDDDGDGSPDFLDCEPLDPQVYPGAPEVCDNLDNDCTGTPDEGCGYVGFDVGAVAIRRVDTATVPAGTYILESTMAGGPGGIQAPAGAPYRVELGLYPSAK